ncbi:hypothetical protein KJ966_29945 [bacterium]|nr:hypothetical protein [bacterium]
MKNFLIFLLVLLFANQNLFAQQGPEQGINARIQPPLERHDISEQVNLLENQLAIASREVDFWRNARFYNDKKKERMRQEKLVYWAQKTVEIRNEITELKKGRAYYQHNYSGDEKFYYKKD